jgi:hypothetical protein
LNSEWRNVAPDTVVLRLLRWDGRTPLSELRNGESRMVSWVKLLRDGSTCQRGKRDPQKNEKGAVLKAPRL